MSGHQGHNGGGQCLQKKSIETASLFPGRRGEGKDCYARNGADSGADGTGKCKDECFSFYAVTDHPGLLLDPVLDAGGVRRRDEVMPADCPPPGFGYVSDERLSGVENSRRACLQYLETQAANPADNWQCLSYTRDG